MRQPVVDIEGRGGEAVDIEGTSSVVAVVVVAAAAAAAAVAVAVAVAVVVVIIYYHDGPWPIRHTEL